jgi:3-oxoacyl-[acyl-carrier-protein] synthase-3
MYLSRLAVWHPEERLTNADLGRMVDTSDEWIVSRVGIRERRRAPPDMRVHQMGALAARQALDAAPVELLVCGLSVTDYHVPSTANLIAAEIGCNEAAAFDVRAACSSFVFSLHALRGLFALGELQRALLVVPEAYTHVTDYTDRGTCILWGDAAFACLVTRDAPAGQSLEVLDTFIGSRSQDALSIQAEVSGKFKQNGNAVHAFAIRKMSEVVETSLKRCHLSVQDLAYFVGHQANLGILQRACERVGLPPEKHLSNIEMFGNCGAAGAPSVLAQNAERFRAGDRIAVATVGSGLSWGGALLRARDRAD